MVKVTCQYTGIEFEAASKRSKNHPVVSNLLAEANRDGWYSEAKAALEAGREAGLEKIEEYKELLAQARETGLGRQTANYRVWAEEKRERKSAYEERQYRNQILRSHGYTWHKSSAMGALDDYKDGEWELTAPDGREVTVSEAMAEINSKKKVEVA